ncbi:hypothetical protein BC826DRAFT_1111219 [Russula brevipes]|nr:hypothetical protein BC826DRAFT_1111219 [Russula brevipes]
MPLVHLRVAAMATTLVHGRRMRQAEHLFCNFFPSSNADPPPTLDSDAELESLEILVPSSLAASQPIVCILVLWLTPHSCHQQHQVPLGDCNRERL